VAEWFWGSILLLVLAGAGLSFLVERLLLPGTLSVWKRPAAALAIHLGVWLMFFAFELAVFRRPWFAAAIVLTFLFFVVLVSNAKFHSLREPFIFQDFEYFTDTLKHPRLYFPFLGPGKVLLASAGFGASLSAGLTLEPSLTGRISPADFFLVVAALVVLGLALLWLGAKKKLPVAFDPETDLRRLGLITSLWRYGEEERKHCCVPPPGDFAQPGQEFFLSAALPDLVVVQSESFFDIRDLCADIRPEVLREFDSLRTSAVFHGKLAVPAWGANTVRTEFSFLSGLRAEELGIHRFNPYRKLARQGIPTLAGFLRNRGYRTVCIHPYPSSFYARDVVYPFLGFDEFIDIRSFNDAEKAGPYIGDIALAEKVGALLSASSTQPIFVFVITMENHGPLHWEKVRASEVECLYLSPPPASCDDLTIYLRHLRNADRMAGMLRDRLEALPGSPWLCWFGDHVPIMPGVYGVMGLPDGRTDYLIWGKGGETGKESRLDLNAEDLGRLLLEQMGLLRGSKEESPGRCHSQASS
jgi:hypothetical protein